MWKFISTSCPALVLVAPGRDFLFLPPRGELLQLGQIGVLDFCCDNSGSMVIVDMRSLVAGIQQCNPRLFIVNQALALGIAGYSACQRRAYIP